MQKSILLVLLIMCQITNAQISETIKENIKQRVDEGYTPSIVVGIIDESGTELFNYGKTTFKYGKAVDENTIYEIGSISKVFTSLVLAQMIEKGEMHLDDPIEKYLPKEINVPSYNGTKITLRDLSTHSSGLPGMPTNIDLESNPGNPYLSYGEKGLLEFLNDYKLTREPGIQYEYSNYAVGLLGHILSKKTNMSYEEMIKKMITNKWKMSNTTLSFSEAQKEKLAIGHAGKKQVSNWDFDALAGAGAIRSNVKDMLEFLSYQMELKDSDMKYAIRNSQQLYFTTGANVALGWHIYNGKFHWHNGGTGGYRTFTGIDKENKRGIIVMTNSTESVDDIGLHWLDNSAPLQEVKKMINVDEKILESYVGIYDLMGMIKFTVTTESGQLYVKLTGQDTFPVYPESDEKFYYKVVDAQLTFKKDDAGKVNALILHQNGMNQEAKRMND